MNQTEINKITNISAIMALAMAPVPANSLGYNDISMNNIAMSTTLQILPDSIAFLPIGEATGYIKSMVSRIRFNLKNLKAEWEKKRIPIENESQFFQTHLLYELEQRIALARKFISAAKIALGQTTKNEEYLRKEIITFGRSAADLLYSTEDFLSFIKQTRPPEAVSRAGEHLDTNEVRAMISAEHKNLGLSTPLFH